MDVLKEFVTSLGWLGVGMAVAAGLLAREARSRPATHLAGAWAVVGLGVFLVSVARLSGQLTIPTQIPADQRAVLLSSPLPGMVNLAVGGVGTGMLGLGALGVRHWRTMNTGRLSPSALLPWLAAVAAAPFAPSLKELGPLSWAACLVAFSGAGSIAREREDGEADAATALIATGVTGLMGAPVTTYGIAAAWSATADPSIDRATKAVAVVQQTLVATEAGAFGLWMMLAPVGAAWIVTQRRSSGAAHMWSGALAGGMLGVVGLALAFVPILAMAVVLAKP